MQENKPCETGNYEFEVPVCIVQDIASSALRGTLPTFLVDDALGFTTTDTKREYDLVSNTK